MRVCGRAGAAPRPAGRAPAARGPREHANASAPRAVLTGRGKCVGRADLLRLPPGLATILPWDEENPRVGCGRCPWSPADAPDFLPRGSDPGRPRSHSVKKGQPWPDDRRPARCQPGWGTCRSSSGPWPTASRPSCCPGAMPPWWSATCITRSARSTSPRARPGWRTSSSTCCSRGPRGSPRGRSTAWRSWRPGSRTPRRGRTARITGSPSPPTAGSWR